LIYNNYRVIKALQLIGDLRAENSKLESDNESLKVEIEEVKLSLEEKEQEIERIKHELEESNRELREIKEKEEVLEKKIIGLLSKLDVLGGDGYSGGTVGTGTQEQKMPPKPKDEPKKDTAKKAAIGAGAAGVVATGAVLGAKGTEGKGSKKTNDEVMIEESVLGWKEYELEVMRDKKDNVVIVCSIENFDPMGVHTGDSITVAPIQTLTDKEWQQMRDWSFACIREIGVETGGSNIQFAVNPENGRMVIIEMNPRVSRSSALASKATGFPIAKIAAKLAVGYTLDEIPNDITKETPSSFEPTIDYCVVKIPRFAFEKFPQADATLTSQMKSVGEAMAIGRTFKEALQKALRSLEIGAYGLGGGRWGGGRELRSRDEIERKLIMPCAERIFYIRHAFRAGFTLEEINHLTHIDRWFLQNIKEILDCEDELAAASDGRVIKV